MWIWIVCAFFSSFVSRTNDSSKSRYELYGCVVLIINYERKSKCTNRCMTLNSHLVLSAIELPFVFIASFSLINNKYIRMHTKESIIERMPSACNRFRSFISLNYHLWIHSRENQVAGTILRQVFAASKWHICNYDLSSHLWTDTRTQINNQTSMGNLRALFWRFSTFACFAARGKQNRQFSNRSKWRLCL